MTRFKMLQTGTISKNLHSKDIIKGLHNKNYFKGAASLGIMDVGSLGTNEGGKEFSDFITQTDLTKIKKNHLLEQLEYSPIP